MPKCHDLKKDEIYGCGHCKLELQVLKECECSDSTQDCACYNEPNSCSFICCGNEMKKIF